MNPTWLDEAYELGIDGEVDPAFLKKIDHWSWDCHEENIFDDLSKVFEKIDLTRFPAPCMVKLIRSNYVYYAFITSWKPFILRCRDELLRREKPREEISSMFQGLLGPDLELDEEFQEQPEPKKRRNQYS